MASSSSSSKYPHPIYMDHDLHTVSILTPFNVNYWKIAMLNHIKGIGLIDFIDGTNQPPPMMIRANNVITEPGHEQEIENPKYTEWKQIDDYLRQLIMSTMQDDFMRQFSSSVTEMTSVQLWTFIIQNVHRPPRMTHPDRVSNQVAERQNFTRYLPLHKATVEGNMKSLEKILKKEPTAVRAIITGASETALMIASQKRGNNNFVKKLISLMTKEDLAMQNSFGCTAINGAAVAGNVEALRLMVEKNAGLPNIHDIDNLLPLHYAAYAGQKDSVEHLLEVTDKKFLEDLMLVHALISGSFFDICLFLLQRFPTLAITEVSPLELLTYRHSAFRSGTQFSFWQRMIYSYLPSELESRNNYFESGDIENLGEEVVKDPSIELESLMNYCKSGDIENPGEEVAKGFKRRTNLSLLFWQLAGKYVPQIRRIQEKKVMHTQALQLLRFICFKIAELDGKRARDLIGHALADAAIMGNVEVVEEILVLFPNALYLLNESKHSVFHIAIANRKANVFNLIYQMTTPRHFLLAQQDKSYNTALHVVAHLVGGTESQVSLDLRSSGPGAALQMQRELQWFKEVEKLSRPQDQEARNIYGKTPATIFTETHEVLAKEGEQWMKDRANSGLIIATLIATIVFASAITVPGGSNSSTGLPLFSQRQAFIVFAVSDALALFMSASSMLMFLGILTARYAVQDFLYSLPKRLIIALITLFLSIIFMMIAFTAILYLVFGNERRWVLGLVSSLATIPVLLFAFLQFNPLLDIISSTYGPGIFGKRGDRILF